jgi:hypothetical protein
MVAGRPDSAASIILFQVCSLEFCLKLLADGNGTNEALAQNLMTADLVQSQTDKMAMAIGSAT